MDQNQVRLRPAELPITDTRRFNWANGLSLFLDYYAPDIDIFGSSNWKCPVVMYVHGGGHIIGSRKDYSRPLFASFLENGCIVVSIDYRLMPENTMEAQLEDIEAAQRWCKYILLPEVKPRGFAIDESMFILVGASSGAFLALVSCRTWITKPTAILSLYGLTDLNDRECPGREAIAKDLPEPDESFLLNTISHSHPPTEYPPPDKFLEPRHLLPKFLFTRGCLPEFLLNGLGNDLYNNPVFPQRGSVSEEEINVISPLYWAQLGPVYPKVIQVMGEKDQIFGTSHVDKFQKALEQHNCISETFIVLGKSHAWDIWEPIGGEAHMLCRRVVHSVLKTTRPLVPVSFHNL